MKKIWTFLLIFIKVKGRYRFNFFNPLSWVVLVVGFLVVAFSEGFFFIKEMTRFDQPAD